MSSTDTHHDPTPEFQAALRRTVTDALRRESEFADASRTGSRVRLFVGIGVAASAILVAGIVLGASTGLASAEVLDVRQREVIASNVSATRQFAAMRLDFARTRLEEQRQAFANGTVTRAELAEAEDDFREMTALVARIDRDSAAIRIASLELLRRVPGKAAWSALACGAVAIAGKGQSVLLPTPEPPVTQSGTRTVDLPPAGERSAETIGAVIGLNEVSGSRVLVNDSRRRQVRLFDSTLATSALALDSVGAAAFNYGARWAPLLRYRGDSSLLIEMPSRALRVLDGRGQVVRTLEPPSLPAQLSARSYVDERGRLLYTTFSGYAASADSTPIIRLDLATRSADTVAHLHLGGQFILRGYRDSTTSNAARIRRLVRDSSRYATMDDWAVLSSGTIAIVRGGDYRLDLIRPDGATSSVRVPVDSSRISALDNRYTSFAFGRGMILTDSGRAATDLKKNADIAVMIQAVGDLLGDQSPRSGAAIPDLDGNLWILPPYASATLSEPLVYDVVDGGGTLVERVRLRAGQWIAGFGKGGTVYLISGTRRAGYHLERTRFRVGGR
jgi:hypothetical protein